MSTESQVHVQEPVLPPYSPVGVAVVGAGYWGPNLIRNFGRLPGCQLMAVCDLKPARLAAVAEKYPDLRTTNRLEDVLADPDVAAVVVATPAESHRAIAEAALRAGKHAFVEKPLAANPADAAAIAALAEEVDRVLMVGHIFLYDTAMQRLVALLRQGTIGQIRYAHGVRISMAGTARLDTNIVWDALVHDAYLLPALFGRPAQRVRAVGGCFLSPSIEDVAFVTFDFGDGAIAEVYVSWYALAKARQITLVGSRAILVYDDLTEAKVTLYARRYEQSQERDARGRPYWHWRDEGGQAVPVERAEPLRAECQHFLECIVERKQPYTDGKAGVAAVRILEACQQSLQADNAWIALG